MRGQRSGVIMSLLTVILGYMLFRRYLSSIINRCVQIIGLSIIIATALPITAITLSRFESRSEGIAGFLTWYVGQANIYFNNYALDAGGIRNGDRTINLAKRIINPEDTPNNYVERREMYHNLEIDDYYFTTFVGDFCIDFGPVATVFIFVIFNAFVLMQIRPRDGTIELHQLLLLYFTMCICMQGGMYLFNYSDTANLQIITFGCLYAYLRYHNCLLEHFPKT
jgi:oligosaccharide repeat unit polymerase